MDLIEILQYILMTTTGVAVLGLTVVNLIILGLNIKLYTEIMKEKAQRSRPQ